MQRIYLLCVLMPLLFCCVATTCFAQSISEFEIEELKKNTTSQNLSRIAETVFTKIRIAHQLNNPDPDSAQTIYLEAINICKKNKLNSLQKRILIDYSWSRLRNSDAEESEKCLHAALSIPESQNSFLSKFYTLRINCGIDKLKGNVKMALEQGLNAKLIAQNAIETEGNPIKKAFCELALVHIQSDIANLYKDTKQLEKSIGLQKENLKQIKNWDSDFLKRIEKQESDKNLYLASAYNNLGLTYISSFTDNAKKDTSIENYFINAVKISEQLNNQYILCKSYYNFSEYLVMIGSYKSQHEFLQKALVINQNLNDKIGIIMCKSKLSNNLINQKINPVLALDYAADAMKLIREVGETSFADKSQIFEAYLNALKANKMTDSVLIYSDSLNELREAELQQTFDKGMTEMQTKYETAEKEKEILKQNAEIKQRRAQAYILYGGIAAFAIVAFLSYRSFREKKKSSELLEIKNKKITEQKKEITDSIYYSKRIQQSILPSADFINNLFLESFVLFQSKDIVSGDFYWFEQSKSNENYVFFSAVDCTGHGVPGALLSMIGFNALNKAVIEHGLSQPAEILNFLKEELKLSLGKNRENTVLNDGMDIAFCRLDKSTNELMYAGAFNSLYIVRNGELIEVKANKIIIGASSPGGEKLFTNHTLQLFSGDSLYIFTDGYADQFGGDYGKKFMKSQLRDLLVSIHGKTMREQKDQLLTSFERWRGTHEQVDDILIIGVKV